MTDIREDILARLVLVARGVSGINGAFRNGFDLDESKVPCVVIHDGDETADDADPFRQAAAPRRVRMTPEIYVLVASDPETVGTQMNLYSRRLAKAILADSTLIALTGTSPVGDIRYEGCSTGLSKGRQVQGECRLHFSFGYVLRVSDL